MYWTQTFTIIGVLGVFMFWMFNKLDADIKSQGTRIDQLAGRMDEMGSRIDRLYQMFVDLLKEGKK